VSPSYQLAVRLDVARVAMLEPTTEMRHKRLPTADADALDGRAAQVYVGHRVSVVVLIASWDSTEGT
jgi:hypothetical protein